MAFLVSKTVVFATTYDAPECDPGKLKRLIKPTLGFQSMKTAYATIKGFEVMRMFKKGQFTSWWIDAINGGTEARFINRLFGLYASSAPPRAGWRPSRNPTKFFATEPA